MMGKAGGPAGRTSGRDGGRECWTRRKEDVTVR